MRSTQLFPHAVKGGVVQLPTQVPAWQKAVAPPHTLPQAPQLFGSLATLLQVPPHERVPSRHAHFPAVHVCPPAHAVPHAPQLAESLVGSTHAAPHLVRPIAHAG